ncbi:alpha/beta hydrolase [Streptosporangium sp. CA-135522]|uniref:alpha/beta hydrolase n=1 Tax=Streptosporangium sp. CA-135522 TaxID=3240072 RepID=UPI003D8E2592
MPTPTARDLGTVRWESIALPGSDHEVRVRVFRGGPAPRGWLVWAHGGSWSAGSVDGWHPACADLARAAAATVVSVDYRLAPEHPHPAALLDVLTAMTWAQDQADGPIAVGGDSAGGTIAACAALSWRDRRQPLAAQILAYPPLDPWCRAASYGLRPEAFPSRARLMAAWRAYRGDTERPSATDGTALYSTPDEAEDLTGLAPAILAVGSADPVADDVRGYARRLRAAGNAVELREFDGMQHGTFLTDPALRHWLGATYSRSTS